MIVQALQRLFVVPVEREQHVFGEPVVLRLFDRLLQRDPAVASMLARERVLYVAEHRRRGRGGIRALESRACLGVAVTQRLQPALRFFPEIVERGRGRDLTGHRNLPSAPPRATSRRLTPGVRLIGPE